MNTQLNRFKRFNRINSYKSKRGDKVMNVERFVYLHFNLLTS